MLKKFLSLLILTVIAGCLISAPTFAEDGSSTGSSSSTTSGSSSSDCRYFLGMVSWDCNTGLADGSEVDTDQLKTGIWTAVANVSTDITIIAAYLVIGYVIYSGYLYTFSSGDPGKVATGKKSLYQSLLGLAIIMSANIILNSIRIALGADFSKDCTLTGNCYSIDSVESMIFSMIGWVTAVAGIISAIFVVYGGISYATSAGDAGKLQKAKNMITYALIGLAIVALAEIITAFASNMIREANQTSLIETTKEYYEIKKIS